MTPYNSLRWPLMALLWTALAVSPAGAGDDTSRNSIAASITTPTAYSYGELSNVELGKVIESPAVTISGINTAAPISISGGEYSIAGGSYTSASGTIRNGQTVRVRLTAPSTFNASGSVTLTIGGYSASFKVSTPSFTTIKQVSDMLQANDPVASVGSDGALYVRGVPAGPLMLKTGATKDGAIMLATTGVIPINGHVNGLTYEPLVFGTALRVMPVPNTEARVLELALGVVRVTATTLGQAVSLVSNDTTVTHLVTTAAGQSVIIARDPNSRNIALRISSGKVIVRRSAAGSTDFTDNVIYSGETVVLDSSGKVASVRLGSNGRDESLCGDPITLKVTAAVTVPRLSCAPERLGGATLESLLSTALGKLGLTVQGVSQDSSTGVVTIAIAGKKFRYLPIGDIKVDTSPTLGNAFADSSSSSGTYQIASSGVTFSFASALSSYDELLAAAQKKDSSASLSLLDGGLIALKWQGGTSILQAGAEVTSTSASSSSLELAGDGYYRFTDSAGAQQTMYPAFASTSTVTSTFQQALSDSNLTVTSNSNGTATAASKGTQYKLLPEYAVASAANSHLDELWWVDGSKVYVKYSDNTAQAFAVQ